VIECHYLPNITPDMRCVVKGGLRNGRVLNITSVKPLDQIRGQVAKMWIYCTELVAA